MGRGSRISDLSVSGLRASIRGFTVCNRTGKMGTVDYYRTTEFSTAETNSNSHNSQRLVAGLALKRPDGGSNSLVHIPN